jgi:transmembrane sensor
MGYLEIKELLVKFRNRKISEEELQKLWDLLSDEHKEKIAEAVLIEDLNDFKVDESDMGQVNFEGMLKNIEAKIGFEKQKEFSIPTGYKQKSISWILRVAAIFLLFFVCGGILSYFIFHRPQIVDNTYSEIKAPLGGKSEVTLPDGSHVWLNAGSKIRYQNQFNKGNRNIVLEGEAYFKVAKNKHIPFIVKTGDLSIVAVGTEFNVKAYNDEGIIETTLVEGAVTIHNNHQLKNKPLQQVFLEPKQKAVYVRDQQNLRVEDMNTIKKSNPEIVKPEKGLVYVAVRIDPIPIISWKDNRLIFKGEEMSNLAVMLDRKYNVSISFDAENIKRYRFSGTLEDETLTQVLDVIKLTAPIDYELNGKEVKIFENTQMSQKFSNHLKKK